MSRDTIFSRVLPSLYMESASAPCSRRTRATSKHPSEARCNAVQWSPPILGRSFACAPCSRRTRTTSRRPNCDAPCSGIQPLPFLFRALASSVPLPRRAWRGEDGVASVEVEKEEEEEALRCVEGAIHPEDCKYWRVGTESVAAPSACH